MVEQFGSSEEQCKKRAYIIQERSEKSEGVTYLMYLRKQVCANLRNGNIHVSSCLIGMEHIKISMLKK